MLEVTHEALVAGLGVSLEAHVATGRMMAGHGRALLWLNGHLEAQDELADEIVAGMSTKDAQAAARLAAAPVPDVPMADVALLRDAEVRVTAGAAQSRFVIDVPNREGGRILAVLGAPFIA